MASKDIQIRAEDEIKKSKMFIFYVFQNPQLAMMYKKFKERSEG